MKQEYLSLEVLDIKPASKRAVTIELRAQDQDAELPYRPGQFLTVEVVSPDGRAVSRSCSITSSPHINDSLSLTVVLVEGGRVSTWLHRELRRGMLLKALPPAGRFSLSDLSSSVLLIAGGSGIAPIISMVKSLMYGGSGSAHLLYLVRNADHLHLDSDLRDLEARFPKRLSVQRWLSEDAGRIAANQLRNLLTAHPVSEILICGPATLGCLVRDVATQVGIDEQRIKEEVFPPGSEKEREAPAGSIGGAISVEILADGLRPKTFARTGDRLLGALLAQGIAAPYSCQSGYCGVCRGKIDAEGIRVLESDGLAEDEKQAGYVLACQVEVGNDPLVVDFDA